MSTYSLAVDIGASSGRLILGHLENGKLKLNEIHRFENNIIRKGDHYCWDVERLFQEIKRN
jgi:L-rhamnulokinase (EC 2.7.1.5)